jgi:hypothetical protein
MNAFARTTDDVLRRRFASDPPDFYTVPFSLHDAGRLRRMLEEAGFGDVRIQRLEVPLTAESAGSLAKGLVRGNPVLHAIVERGADPAAVEREVADALARHGGAAPFESRTSALVATARAPEGAW